MERQGNALSPSRWFPQRMLGPMTTNATQVAPEWVGPSSVPAITGGQISKSRAYELMKEGRLPYRQLGRKRLIDVGDLRQLIESA